MKYSICLRVLCAVLAALCLSALVACGVPSTAVEDEPTAATAVPATAVPATAVPTGDDTDEEPLPDVEETPLPDDAYAPLPDESPLPDETAVPDGETGEGDGFLWVYADLSGASLVDSDSDGSGYRSESYYYDDAVTVTFDRLIPADSGEEGVRSRINELEFIESGETFVLQEQDATARLGFPCYRVIYATGENEDAASNLDLYIQTDEWDFRVHTVTSPSQAANRASYIETVFSTVSLRD